MTVDHLVAVHQSVQTAKVDRVGGTIDGGLCTQDRNDSMPLPGGLRCLVFHDLGFRHISKCLFECFRQLDLGGATLDQAHEIDASLAQSYDGSAFSGCVQNLLTLNVVVGVTQIDGIEDAISVSI